MFALSDDSQTCTVSNQTVTFQVKTPSEYIRFDDLIGERPVIEDLIESLKKDDVFYDIGANVGTYSCFVGSKLNSENVIAFEPEPQNIERLQENLIQNGLDIKVIDAALSDTNGTIEFALAGDDIGEGEHAIATEDDNETIEVESARVDSLIEDCGLSPPTVVKIDVEGAELSVLQGMKETLQEHCRLVYVEVHADKVKEYGGTTEGVYSVLKNAGFEIEEIKQRGSQYFVRSKKDNELEDK